MKLGISSYTYMWSIGFQGTDPANPNHAACPARPLTALDLLEKARQLGVRLVQTGPNLPMDQLPDPEFERFIQRAHEWGIELELGTRGLDYHHLIEQVALARRMGATLIRTVPEIEGKYQTDYHSIPSTLRRVLPLLERENIMLAIENGRIPASELSAALNEIGSPSVGVVLDTVNSLAVGEGWKEVTRELRPHVMCLHYKDFTMNRIWHMMGFICEGTPSGKGIVDTQWLLNELKGSRHDHNVIIELWPPEQGSLEETIDLEQAWAIESVAYLRQFIKE